MQTSRLFAGSLLTALLLIPALCPAQTVSIVSGNGQVICPDCAGGPTLNKYAPLVVQVNNSSNQPMANTTVTWVATQQGLSPVTATSVTSSPGRPVIALRVRYPFSVILFWRRSWRRWVLPTSPSTRQRRLLRPREGRAAFATLVSSTGAPPNLSGQVGKTAAPITVTVFSFSGAIANVSLALVPTSSTGPSVSCAPQAGAQAGAQPGIVLTNSSGTATCTPVFGGKIGTGQYDVVVGGILATYGPESLTVTAGPPAIISYVSGNNQTINPGTTAPIALTALVTDLGKNPSDNADVTWTVSPAGSATLSSVVTVTPTTGIVSARVTDVGPGPITVTVALAGNTAVSYTFTINVNSMVTALQAISGNGQQAPTGAAFTDPLIVQVNDNGVALSGVTVTFTVTSGSATVTSQPPSGSSTTSACSGVTCGAVTNSSGQAQVSVTAGSTAGPVVITASVSGLSQIFNLTVIPPGPTITAVLNSAGFGRSPETASPCSLVTVYGTGLAPGIQGVADAYIAPQNQVDGVTATFASIAAPILYVANINGSESVSVQVPCNLTLSTTSASTPVPLVVTVNGLASTPYSVGVTEWSPGIFEFGDSDNQTRAVLIRPDGSVASVTNPARLGETVRMFATGLGQTTPNLFTGEIDPLAVDSSGQLVPSLLPVTAGILVGVNGGGVNVVGAEYAFFGVGVYEIDFVVPTNTTTGNNATLDIVVYQGSSIVFGNASQIAIQ